MVERPLLPRIREDGVPWRKIGLGFHMDYSAQIVRIDPRDFITGPYWGCPRCAKHEFGVLNIHEASYTRKCRACWHSLTLVLPKLKKKVVYLDQFVFSNIMKMLSTDTLGHSRAKSEPLWRQLFECLEVLCGMQLVVCPDSHEHHDESLISPFYEELRHTYEHFSKGISFGRCISIQHRQVMCAFTAYLKGTKPQFELDPKFVTSGGGLHGWNDKVFITVGGTLPNEKQKIQRSRSQVLASLENVFKEWQKGGETFAQAFQREKTAYGNEILNAYLHDMRKRMQMMTGLLPPSLENFMGSANGSLISDLEYVAKMHGFSHEKALGMIGEFVRSGAMNETPANTVSAAMWASLAMQAAAGQKKLPDEGMVTDIKIVSTLLPYCDAMFVDNKCRSLLSDIPTGFKLPYQCQVFSSKTSDEFIRYLNEIRSGATPEHMELLLEVYGPEVLHPAKSIYGVGERKKTIAAS